MRKGCISHNISGFWTKAGRLKEFMWKHSFLRYIKAKCATLENLLKRCFKTSDKKSKHNPTNLRKVHCTFWVYFTAFVVWLSKNHVAAVQPPLCGCSDCFMTRFSSKCSPSHQDLFYQKPHLAPWEPHCHPVHRGGCTGKLLSPQPRTKWQRNTWSGWVWSVRLWDTSCWDSTCCKPYRAGKVSWEYSTGCLPCP